METLKFSMTIDAPAAKVWRALTDTEIVKQYFFGTNQRSDWKKGSPIIWEGEWDGKTYQDKGKILDIVPGKYVKYNYWSSMSGTKDKPENYANITYTLEEADGNGADHNPGQHQKQRSERTFRTKLAICFWKDEGHG